MVSRSKLMAIVVSACSFSGIAVAGSYPEAHVLTEPRELEQAPDIGIGREVFARVDLTG